MKPYTTDNEEIAPSHLVANEKKDKNWILKWGKYIYYRYKNASSGFNLQHKAVMANNKRYRDGMQSVEQYRKQFDCNTSETQKADATYHQLNYGIVSLLPTLADIVQHKISLQKLHVKVSAIDPLSLRLKKQNEWQTRGKMQLRDMGVLQQFDQAAGMPLGGPDEAKLPEDEDALQMALDDYKLQQEVAGEIATEIVLQNNNWEEIQKGLTDDLQTYGVGFVDTSYNPGGTIRVRKMDIMRMVIPYSNKPDYSDLSYVGEVIPMTIADLKEYAQGQFEEEDYLELAKHYGSRGQNGSSWGDSPTMYVHPDGLAYRYDDVKIETMKFRVVTTNKLSYNKYNAKYGEVYRKNNGKKKRGKGVENKIISYKTVYEGWWIVGTDHIFDHGEMEVIPRRPANITDCIKPFHGYAPNLIEGRNKSMVERVVPFVDQFMILWLKFQQMMNNMVPAGAWIDWDAIAMIPNGLVRDGKQQHYNILELLEIYRSQGIGFYRSIDIQGMPTGKNMPITPHEGSLAKDFDKIMQSMIQMVDMMKHHFGMNDATDASTPAPRTSVYGTQAAIASSNNALEPIKRALQTIKAETSRDILQRLKVLARNGGIEVYRESMGDNTIAAIKLGAEFSDREYALDIEAEWTDEDREKFREILMQDVQRTAQGHPGLSPLDIIEILRSKNHKQALFRYKAILKKREKEAHEREMQKIEANNKGAQEAAVLAEQTKQQTLQMDYQLKAQYDAQSLELKIREMSLAHQHKMAEIVAQSNARVEEGEVKHFQNEELVHTKGDVDRMVKEALAEKEIQGKKELENLKGQNALKVAKEKPQKVPASA